LFKNEALNNVCLATGQSTWELCWICELTKSAI